jgi:hypothetical protein
MGYTLLQSASPGGLATKAGERNVTETKWSSLPFYFFLFVRIFFLQVFRLNQTFCPFHHSHHGIYLTGAALGSRPAFWLCTPRKGKVERSDQGSASLYRSANFAACLNISTNIFRVSFPVCVFWFEGWYDAKSTFPLGR